MERQLFTWESFDVLDTMVFAFYDIMLVTQVGSYQVGTKLSSVVMDYENGKMEFSDNNGNVVARFGLVLTALVS